MKETEQSYPFPVYSGLFDHRESIGVAVWEFLWCISRTTKEEVDADGTVWGWVFGGKPIKHEEIAAELCSSARSVRRNLLRLKDEHYIDTIRAPYGEIIKVRKSKKWSSLKHESEEYRAVRNGRSLHNIERPKVDDLPRDDAILPSQRTAKNGHSIRTERSDLDALLAKSGRSNKDIKLDIINKDSIDRSSSDDCPRIEGEDGGVPSTGGAVPQQIPSTPSARIEHHLAGKMGQLLIPHGDIVKIQQFLQEGIPEEIILAGIDQSFSKYWSKFPTDRIRSITYCEPLIRELFYRFKAESLTKEAEADANHRTSVPGISEGSTPSVKRKWASFEYGFGEE